jgi:hypothetical protein
MAAFMRYLMREGLHTYTHVRTHKHGLVVLVSSTPHSLQIQTSDGVGMKLAAGHMNRMVRGG